MLVNGQTLDQRSLTAHCVMLSRESVFATGTPLEKESRGIESLGLIGL